MLQAVIGQSLNKFTPLQLACYTSALANKGTRYEATLLSRVVSWDYQDLIEESKPVVASTLEISEKALAALDQGMRMTGSIGTAEQYLKDYPIAIAWHRSVAGHHLHRFVLRLRPRLVRALRPGGRPGDRHRRLHRARLAGRQSGERLHPDPGRLFLQLHQI